MLARFAFSRVSSKSTPDFSRSLSFDPAGSWGMGKSKKRKQRERAKKQKSQISSEMNRAGNRDERVDDISSSHKQVNQKYSHGSRDVGKGQSQDAGWRSHGSRWNNDQRWNNDHHSAASPFERNPSHDVYRDNYDHHGYGYGYGPGSSHEFTRGSSFRDQRDASQSQPASTLDQPHLSQSYSSNRSQYSQNRFGRRQDVAARRSNQHSDLLYPKPSNSIRSFQTAQSNYSPKEFSSDPRYHQKSDSPPRIHSQNRWSGLFNHEEGSDSAGPSSISSGPRASSSSSYQPSSLPQNPYDHYSTSHISSLSKLPKKEQGTGRKLSKKERAMQGSDSFGNRDTSSSFYLDPQVQSSDNTNPEKKVWKNSRLGVRNAFTNSFSDDSDNLRPSSRYLEEASIPSQLRLDPSVDPKSNPNQPLKAPLLILDLNGTLLFRKKSALSGASSMEPELRPFLETFLRYCLGFGKDANGLGGSRRGRESRARRDALQEAEHEMEGMDIDQTLSLPHGTHFWSRKKRLKELKKLKDAEKRSRNEEEEEEEEKVRYQVLIWSSAQPQNVDSMVQAIFNSFSDSSDPEDRSSIKPDPRSQDSELSPSAFLRVYARDTLVDQSQYYRKSPSIKNLEIIWKALNERDESELLAEDRKQAEWVKGRGSHVRFLGEDQDDTPRWKSGSSEKKEKAYGSNNTLLLDDSSDKARMQPFNHLLLHEFDSKSAKEFQKFKRFFFELRKGKVRKGKDFPSTGSQESISDQSDNQEMDDAEAEDDPDATRKSFDSFRVDTTLIEVIGILEHARYQTNVCNWIKEGGLGSFGSDSTSSSKPSWELVWKRLLEDEGEKSETSSMEDEKEEATQMLESSLEAAKSERNDDFWLEQGLNTLRKHGIRLKC